MKQLYFLFLLSSTLGFAQLTPPTELQAYYADVDFNATGLTLFDDLATETISKHTNYISYTPGVWEASKITDLDPLNNANVLLIYGYNDTDGNYITDRTRSKNLNGGSEGSDWNREHTFPNSLGQPSLNSSGTNVPPYADAHNLRPSDVKMNSNRGNLKFVTGTGNARNISGSWYPGDEWKGDVARIVMYMYLRYGLQCFPSYTAIGTTNAVDTNMINLLLQWNSEDPVSTIEDNRNLYHANTSNTYAQGNRNPFIDNPYLATIIWGGPNAENRWGSSYPSDTEAPTTPINLATSNPTTTSVDLSWDASTDDTGVVTYNIYVDGSYYVSTNSANTSISVTALTSNTTYTFSVLAADLANNTSSLSATTQATTLVNASNNDDCANETFINMPANSSSYSDRLWTGDDGGQWSATRARTDQVLNGRAIAMDVRGSSAGSLTSPTLPNGIGSLTVSTLRIFSGGSGSLDVFVNGILKGTIPYSGIIQTTTLSNIDVADNVTIVISESTSGGDRVAIDDLSWTCFPVLGLDDFEKNVVTIYPNPAKNNFVYFSTTQNLNIIIYDILGKQILTKNITSTKNYIDISNLNKGMYLVRINSSQGSTTKKLIRQ